MNIHIQYLEPKRKDICVAFCFFNPCGYVRPLQNLLFFENKLKAANIPYFSIEMVIGDQPPILVNPTLRVYSKSSMFYKEALWNRLEKEIPPEYTKICFLDSDIIYQRADWLDSLSILLDTYDIVHPFNVLTYLDITYNLLQEESTSNINTMSYVARLSIKNNKIQRSAPGLGWALTRSFFNRMGGFFDKNLLGASDQIFCGSILKTKTMLVNTMHPLINDYVRSFFDHLYNLSYSVTYLYCEALHLYHGTFKNRQYESRENIIKNITDPWDTIYEINQDNFWELKDAKLNEMFHTYFINRAEDGLIPIELVNPVHIQYSRPLRKDICIAFAFFNSCEYIRPAQNMLLFINKLRLAGIPYYSIEMVIGNANPILVNPTLRFYSKSAFFYKEALWNRLEKEIPSEYTKICFLDSDIIFERADWLDTLSEMLESYDLVHPFKNAKLLNISYTEYAVFESVIKKTDRFINTGGGGYGWAIRRDFFSNIGGFFDMCILGGGDELFYTSIMNQSYNTSNNPMFILLKNEYITYKMKVQEYCPRVTFLESTMLHLFHGSIQNRNYETRYNVLKDVNWISVFIKNSDGFWESMDESINLQCLEYFKNRKEDSLTSVIIETVDIPTHTHTHTPEPSHTPEPKQYTDPPKVHESPKPTTLAKDTITTAREMELRVSKILAKNAAKSMMSYNNPVRKIYTSNLNINITSASSLAANKALQRRERILNTVHYDRSVVHKTEEEYEDE